MKQPLLSLLLIVYGLNLFCQTTYYRTLGDTNRWYVSGFLIGVKSSEQQSTADIGSPCLDYYRADRDSVYSGKAYKVFEQEQSFCVFGFGGTQPLGRVLIREDSLLRKIYIVHPDSANECVAMDFGMNIGD